MGKSTWDQNQPTKLTIPKTGIYRVTTQTLSMSGETTTTEELQLGSLPTAEELHREISSAALDEEE